MGFKVNLYSISKRDNSTKRPSGEGKVYNDCIMKHGCGILNPTMSFDMGLSTDPSQYNYAYISEFNRYYFIDEWYFDNALWTAQMKVDVLATYKNEIGQSSLYVLRSSAEYDGAVSDQLYPCKTGCSYSSTTKTNPWTGTSFVIGIINRNASFGSIEYYVVDRNTLSGIATYLMDPANIITTANGFNFDDFSQALQLSLVDPMQYIKTCMMMPVNAGDYSDLPGDASIYCYNWRVGSLYGRPLYSQTRIYKSYSFAIPKHPDTNSRGNYVNSSPYTSLTLTMPPYGCIEIDTSITCNASTLDVNVEVDPITGLGILVISCNGIVLNRIESQIGVPISLASVSGGMFGALGNMVGGGIANGGAIGNFFDTIGNGITAKSTRAQTLGSTGSFVSNRGTFRLDAQFFRPVADDIAHNGRPLCQKRTLSTLPGYQLIQDGDVTITGTSVEDAKIRSYLEGGYYYE